MLNVFTIRTLASALLSSVLCLASAQAGTEVRKPCMERQAPAEWSVAKRELLAKPGGRTAGSVPDPIEVSLLEVRAQLAGCGSNLSSITEGICGLEGALTSPAERESLTSILSAVQSADQAVLCVDNLIDSRLVPAYEAKLAQLRGEVTSLQGRIDYLSQERQGQRSSRRMEIA